MFWTSALPGDGEGRGEGGWVFVYWFDLFYFLKEVYREPSIASAPNTVGTLTTFYKIYI